MKLPGPMRRGLLRNLFTKAAESAGLPEALREPIFELLAHEFDQRPTLRDQFALAALPGLIARESVHAAESRAGAHWISGECYRIADAMLLARQESES